MSRGPGHVERAIEAAFNRTPDDVWPLGDLAMEVYRGINRVEKKHRAAVARAAAKVCWRTGWNWYLRQAPAGENVYYNRRSVRSYALARLRSDFVYNNMTIEQLKDGLDNGPDHPIGKCRALMEPETGAWWRHTEIAKLALDGKHEEADRLIDENNRLVTEALELQG